MSPLGQAAWLVCPTATEPSVQLQLTWDPPDPRNNNNLVKLEVKVEIEIEIRRKV